jgi:hypothetical protein
MSTRRPIKSLAADCRKPLMLMKRLLAAAEGERYGKFLHCDNYSLPFSYRI